MPMFLCFPQLASFLGQSTIVWSIVAAALPPGGHACCLLQQQCVRNDWRLELNERSDCRPSWCKHAFISQTVRLKPAMLAMSVHNLRFITIDLDALACQHGPGHSPRQARGLSDMHDYLTLKGAPFLRMLMPSVAGTALSERLMKTGCKSHSWLIDSPG